MVVTRPVRGGGGGDGGGGDKGNMPGTKPSPGGSEVLTGGGFIH